VVDKDPNALLHGRADGMRARLVEMFDSMGYGLQESVLKESFPLLKSASWLRDANGDIQRVEQLPLFEDHRRPLVTPYQPAALSQGRIEQLIQRAIVDVSDGKVRVERGREAVSLVIGKELAKDPEAHPVSITLQDSDKGFSANSKYNGSVTITTPDWHNEEKPATTNGTTNGTKEPASNGTATNGVTNVESRNLETIKAKYVIGCDGARSWLRKQLGFKTEGSHTNTVW
jgi:phenol 2-monooxygenase